MTAEQAATLKRRLAKQFELSGQCRDTQIRFGAREVGLIGRLALEADGKSQSVCGASHGQGVLARGRRHQRGQPLTS
jgi:hypothetical protein